MCESKKRLSEEETLQMETEFSSELVLAAGLQQFINISR